MTLAPPKRVEMGAFYRVVRPMEIIRRVRVHDQPAAKPSHGALRVLGATHHIRSPGGQVYPTRMDEPHHHPRQGLEVALIHPRGLLAQDKNQRIIQMRCVLQGDLPGKSVSQGSILTSHGERGECASLLSVNQVIGAFTTRIPSCNCRWKSCS